MSRIGNNPITVPEGVKVSINGRAIEVSGKNGIHTHYLHENIKINLNENVIILERINDSSVSRSMHGTTRQIINNMVIGVSDGFKKELEIVGVGYQASVQGSRLKLQLGYSHDIFFDFPDGITIDADRTAISVKGNDKQLVGSVASKIRSFRKPEPYKGKGVRYKNEYIRIKQGKTVGD
jgi:large subunit ribosomal protein L6